MSGPSTSGALVVTTFNWPSALDLVLESALGQSVLPAEVLVADDGSAEETGSVIEGYVSRFAERGVPLRHVWHPDLGFRAGAIRNRAIAAATQPYIILVDGDCVLHRDFVRSHLVFARRGHFVQGTRVLLDAETTRRALSTRRTRWSALDGGLRNRLNALSLPWLSPLVPTSSNPLRGVRSANMGLWRSDVVRVNGFDERFVGWGREDSEFVVRLTNAGVRRRKLKFGGILYHLWHDEQPRDALAANDQLLAEIRASGARWCERGVDQYLADR
ncbi:MAG: glycosyltransferase family 2 protein [Gemmatimonadaceae bacterium]